MSASPKLSFINKYTREVKRFDHDPKGPWLYLSPVSKYQNDEGQNVWRMEAGKIVVEITENIERT